MSTTQAQGQTAADTLSVTVVDMKLEVVVIPVADVDRAMAFYTGLGWRLDANISTGDDFRVVQVTPRGSDCSVIFGQGVTGAEPGSTQGLQLVVSDLEVARAELMARGADVSEIFHDAGGVFHHAGTDERVSGPAPEHGSYGSFCSFDDADGNTWFVQEVTQRLPGRVAAGPTADGSSSDLAEALRRAAAAHGEHEARTGQADENWPDWYAEYMVRERAGEPLPT